MYTYYIFHIRIEYIDIHYMIYIYTYHVKYISSIFDMPQLLKRPGRQDIAGSAVRWQGPR